MKFKIQTDVLKKGLDVVNHATASITTTPILENILLKVNFNNIILTSNNLEMAIEYVISEDLEIETEGSFCIPSKLFTSYIGLVQDDEVSIELLNDDSVKIATASGKMKIKGLEASEFPLIPTIREEVSLDISGKIIKKSIDKTLFSSAEGNIRPTLAGIYVNIKDNEVIFASTDSFRLSEYKTILDENVPTNFSQILPSKTANQIKSILGDNDEVKIVSGDNQIAFLSGNIKIYSRLLNGKFPDYTSFFPTTFSTKAEVNRVDLIQALKKINLVSRENNYSIKMSLSSTRGIELETSETQIGEGDVTLVGAVEGEDNIVGINSTYFLEVLGVIETTHVSISFENPLSPIVITPTINPENTDNKHSFRHIIMPLKI
ncbi:DNA polymerase III subunit beta [Candidatus Gracilibacteria bacterium]|nr:DNA polymerase III subunit beta [Candidatus Gracilibacteria bacterium]